MNHVERFRALMSFQPVDRLPRVEWASYWDRTIQRWTREGLPAALSGHRQVREYFGLDPYWQHRFHPRGRTTPEPARHGAGLIADEPGYDALRPHLFPDPDPVMPKLADWGARQRRGEAVVWITIEGAFWFPRTLLGIERHLVAFYEQPELIHRINRDLADYHAGLLERLGEVCAPAFMTFAEDMSYNHGSMISRAMFEEFIAPYYRRLVPALEQLGTIPFVDSDGNVEDLAGWMREVGVRGLLPLERQAGVDAAALRRRYPDLLMIGHYDKMVMACGETALRGEFERLLPVMREGGFIASVDHQTPPGVSLEQYRVYLRLLDEYTRRAVAPTS